MIDGYYAKRRALKFIPGHLGFNAKGDFKVQLPGLWIDRPRWGFTAGQPRWYDRIRGNVYDVEDMNRALSGWG